MRFAFGMFGAGVAVGAGVSGVWGPAPLWFTAAATLIACVAFLLSVREVA